MSKPYGNLDSNILLREVRELIRVLRAVYTVDEDDIQTSEMEIGIGSAISFETTGLTISIYRNVLIESSTAGRSLEFFSFTLRETS